jgi:hypothetical protein
VCGVADRPASTECNTAWVTRTDTSLSAASVMTLTTPTLSECLWLCQSVINFTCSSVVFYFSQLTCRLYNVNQYTVGVTTLSSGGWDYYELHCCEFKTLGYSVT